MQGIDMMCDCTTPIYLTRKKFTKRTKEDVLQELAAKNPTVKLIGVYKNTQTKTEWKCKICGHEFSNKPSKLLVGRACPECGKKKIGDKLRKPHSVFVDEMARIMPTITITGKYTDCATKVECRCNVCKNDFMAWPGNLRKREGCPKCGLRKLAKINRKSHEQFIAEMAAINNTIRIVGKYQGDAIKIRCKCLECEKDWEASPSNLLQGSGCPRCARNQTSFMERAILLFLETSFEENEVLSRNKSIIGKELDIYIKPLKVAIEPGTWSLHTNRQKQDLEKYNLCKQKGIRLITIYDCFSGNKEDIIFNNDDLWVFNTNLGESSKRQELLNCIRKIFYTINLEYGFSTQDEIDLLNKAKLEVSRRRTNDVVRELSQINPNIELLSNYEDTKTKMRCHCKACQNEWDADYEHLIRRKQGCPKCNGSNKPLVNLDTGEVFDSTTAAAKHLSLTPSAIGVACRNGTKCHKHHWAYISSLTPKQISELRTKFPDTFTIIN